MKRFYNPAMMSLSVLAVVSALPLACDVRANSNDDVSMTPDGPGGTAGVGDGDSGTAEPNDYLCGDVGANDASCGSFAYTQAEYSEGMPDCTYPTFVRGVDSKATDLVDAMTLEEKIGLLSGGDICPDYNCDFEGTGAPAHGVDEFKMRDGPRGVHAFNGEIASTWAVAVARAASFDRDLERRVGRAQGAEMRALKFDLALAPTVNTLRHPGWARGQETYGEDPVVLGELGAAFTQGVQEYVPGCPKHFAGNNTDENRNKMIAEMDEQTLRENYTRAFKIVIEKSDPACLMAAYNGVNGDFSAENEHLLTTILRDDWGWEGFVVSDWWATKEDGVKTLKAGLDLEMPDKRAFEDIPQAIQTGALDPSFVDQAATRILNARAKFGQFERTYKNSPLNQDIVKDPGHMALALETAVKGAVLLKNENMLPIGKKAAELGFGSADAKSIVVLGPDALRPNTESNEVGIPHGMGDRGSSNTNPPYAINYFEGIKARADEEGIEVTHSENIADAAGKDLVIIPVTMQHEDEGEAFGGGGDRDDMTLTNVHPIHWTKKPTAFINEVAAVNKNVIVLLAVGSAIIQEDWADSAQAIVQPFYPGQEAGNAVADLLFGDENFTAKLPFTVAMQESDYPIFGNLVESTDYDYLHGYRKFEAENITPRYWFGYGLSYTTYEYSDLTVLCDQVSADGRLNVEVTVTNTGDMAGEEIVHAYIGYPNTSQRRPPKELKDFKRIALAPGESGKVQLNIPVSEMAYWSMAENGWVIESGVEHTVLVGPSANPERLLSAPFTIN